MILIKENTNFGPFCFTTYKPYYYRNKKAQEENIKTWFKYIYSISINQYGAAVIRGKAGTKTYYFYTVKQAIKRYNELAKEK